MCADVSYLGKGSRRIISRQTGYPYLVLTFFQLLQDVQLVPEEKDLFPGKAAVESVHECGGGGKKTALKQPDRIACILPFHGKRGLHVCVLAARLLRME